MVTGSWSPSPLIVSRVPSAFWPEQAYILRVAHLTLRDVPIYYWYIIILLYMFVYHIYRSSVYPACRKRRLNGTVSLNNRIKKVSVLGRAYYRTLWRWEPYRRYNFFSPPACLCRKFLRGETITRVNGNVSFFAGKRSQNFLTCKRSPLTIAY